MICENCGNELRHSTSYDEEGNWEEDVLECVFCGEIYSLVN